MCPITNLKTLGSRIKGFLGALRCLKKHNYSLLVAAAGQLKAVSLLADGDRTEAVVFKFQRAGLDWILGQNPSLGWEDELWEIRQGLEQLG